MADSWTTRTTVLLALLVIGVAGSLPWTVHDVFLGEIDASLHVRTAQALAAGDGYTYLGEPFTNRPPGFPMLLVPVIRAFGVHFLAMNAWVSLFGAVAVVSAFLAFRRRLGDYAAFAVAVTLWINPMFQRLANEPMSDVPGLALLMLTLAIDRWAQRAPGRGRMIVLGVAVALTAYVRTIFVLLLPALLLSALLRERPPRAVLRRWAVVAITAVALLAPWSVRDAIHSGDGASDQTRPQSQSTTISRTDKGDPTSPLVSPSDLGQRVSDRSRRLLTMLGHRMRPSEPAATSAWLGAFAVACLFVTAIRRRDTGDFFALGVVATLAVWHTSRGRVLLPVFLFALPAVIDVMRWALGRVAPPNRTAVILAMAALLLGIVDARDGLDWDAEEEQHAIRVSEAAELNAAIPEDAVVAAFLQAPREAVYLNRPVYSLLPIDGVRDLLERHSIDTVILRGATPADLRDEVLRTFSHESLGPRLVLCRRTGHGRIPDERLNVLLISIDSLRADHVSGYGAPAGASPAIDALAAKGQLFANAVAQAPWTLPSHASVMTSLYPRTHRTDSRDRRLPADVPTLAAALAEAGYDTRAVVSGPFMKEEFGLGRGFARYDDSLARVTHRASHQMVTSAKLHERALEFLDDMHPPFFLFLHYWDVHYDYIPPSPLDERFDPDYAGRITGSRFIDNADVHAGMSKADLDRIRALYDGELAWVSGFLDRLMDGLEERGLDAHTVIVLTADHGDEFFEHGEKGHQHSLYQELVHVPLVFRVPGLTGGRVFDDPVELIDIMPTLLDVTRVPAPEGLQGRSLLPTLLGRAPAPRPRFTQTTKALKKRGKDWKGSSWSVIDGPKKLIVFEEDHYPPEVYDLVRDPAEQHDLGAASSPELFDLLEEWRARTPEGPGESFGKMDDETRRTLESLGYVGD